MTKLFLAAALALGPFAATAENVRQAVPDVILSWQSVARNGDILAKDFERLYMTLYNTGNLLVRPATVRETEFVEETMRREGVYFGDFFPMTLDALMCDLNEDVCSRDLRPVNPNRFADLTQHVGGFEPSAGRWRIGENATIFIPDYAFERTTSLTVVPVDRNWSAQAYIAEDGVDCSQFGTTCEEVVRMLNPPRPQVPKQTFDTSERRTASVPVPAYTTRLPLLTSQGGSETTQALTELGSRQTRGAVTFAPPDQTIFETGYRDFVDKEGPDELVVDGIRSKIRSVLTAPSPMGVSSEPHYFDQRELFQLIGHPFFDRDTLPTEFARKIEVLVLEQPFEEPHCDLPPITTPELVENAADDCGALNPAPHPLDDHTPHVVGLISAPMNARGIVGLNPEAHVTLGPISRLFSENEVDRIARHLSDAALGEARVVNASWGFDRQIGGDDLARVARVVSQRLLIVAAAGNEDRNLDEDCRVYFACLHDEENVITVVGLDRKMSNPELWRLNGAPSIASNYGGVLSIAAVADKVLSTVSGNKVGHMSGTSQAAPQVTAAASLIFAAAETIYPSLLEETGARLPPKYVKDRLIYTADFFPSLHGKVFSGRLNVERATDINKVRVVLRGTQGHVLRGSLIRPPADHIECFDRNGPNTQHRWGAIQRMVLDAPRDRYVIYKYARPGDLSSKLLRIEGCNLNMLSNMGALRVDGEAVEFRLGDVVDYTAAFLE